MDNGALKKLSRLELLEILLEQTKRIEELEHQVEKLNEEILARKIEISQTGSLAEASLKLTEIFKEADEAATIYRNNIINQVKKEEKQLKKELRELKAKKLSDIEKACSKREEQAMKKLKEVEEKITILKEENKTATKISASKAKTSRKKFK